MVPLGADGTTLGRPVWLLGAIVATRVLASVAALTLLYFAAPLDRPVDGSVALVLAAMIAVLVVLLVVQTRAIVRSPLPGLRAVEGLAVAVPLLILSFSTAYFMMSSQAPGTFNEPLTRTDALYFALTMFSTVGLGDIAPVTQTGRAAVSVHMTVNLLVVGIGIRVITSAVQEARHRAAGGGAASPDAAVRSGSGGAS